MGSSSSIDIVGFPEKEQLPVLKSGVVHQIFVPIVVPIGQEVALTLVQAVNQVSKEILPKMAEQYPDRVFQMVTRQVIVLGGTLTQNLLMLMDLVVD